jgi:integrase
LEALPRSLSGYVFVNPDTGTRWNQIQKVWDRARKGAGLSNLWFHDLRRSFVTNARRRGVPESVVMKMSGHRTREVFERYNIINDEDLREATRVIEEGQKRELGVVINAETEANGTEQKWRGTTRSRAGFG